MLPEIFIIEIKTTKLMIKEQIDICIFKSLKILEWMKYFYCNILFKAKYKNMSQT